MPQSMFFLLIFLYRCLNSFFVVSFYVADECFQSLEIAYKLIFGVGNTSWEWRPEYRIRSFLHPMYFSIGYYFLKVFNLHKTNLLIIVPRIQQALIAAIADYYTWKLAEKLYGKRIGLCTLALTLFCWFNVYSLPRTLSNCVEQAFFVAALYFWTINKFWKSSICMGIATSARITSVIPIAVHVLLDYGNLKYAIKPLTISAIFFVILLTILDTIGSRTLFGPDLPVAFAGWEFFKANVLQNHSAYFGTHPFHWYFVDATSAILGPCLPFLFFSRFKYMFLRIGIVMLIISFLPHKEFRFLSAVFPLMLICVADGFLKIYKKIPKIVLFGLIISNFLVTLHYCRYTQRTIQESVQISKSILDQNPQAPRSVFNFGPCYSIPGQCYFGTETRYGYLSCEPKFTRLGKTRDDDAETFYEKSESFLKSWDWKKKWGSDEPSSVIIMYDEFYNRNQKFGIMNEYFLVCIY